MPHRKRRANGNSGRSQRRSSPAEFLPQTRASPRAHADEFDSLRHRHSTIRAQSAPFQRRPRAQSVSGNATAFKAYMHNHPYLASQCRTLKWQTTSLKHKLEELAASVEELQPEQSAMDWVASVGSVVYMPVNVTRDNEAPRVSPAHPEIKGPETSTFADSSQTDKKTENCFATRNATNSSVHSGFGQTPPQGQAGQTDRKRSQYTKTAENYCGFGNPINPSGYTGFGSMHPQAQPAQTDRESSQDNNKSENSFGFGNRNATNPSGYTGFGQMHPQAHPAQTDREGSLYNNKTGSCFGNRNATNPSAYPGFGQTQPQAQAGQRNWTGPCTSSSSLPRFGGQAETTTTNMDFSKTARRRPGPRHAYVEDDIPEEPGNGGM